MHTFSAVNYEFAMDTIKIESKTSTVKRSAWQTARKRAGLENVFGESKSRMPWHFRVHDLRVTCSTWLREAGVSKEDRY